MEEDVIDCENCGHDLLSAHGLKGCLQDECPCKDKWTRADKRLVAKDYGVRFRQ